VVGCSSAAIVAVGKAAPPTSKVSGSSGNSGPSHPTSRTQAIITAEDAASPGIITPSHYNQNCAFENQCFDPK